MVVKAKICGLTRPDDAALAVRHGAWRLGVIRAGGPRQVEAAAVREIVAAAAGVPVLGVFGQASIESITEFIAETGLSGVQLHHDGGEEFARTLRASGAEVWRVALLAPGEAHVTLLSERTRAADALLVEPRHPDGMGGKGVALDFSLAAEARGAVTSVPFVLAGGLHPGNVATAIRLVGPDAVDVSSGVESVPGRKDPERLIRFLEIVRDARASS